MQDSLVSRSSTSTYINGSATLIVGAVSLKRIPGPHILTMSLRAASMPRLDNTCASAVRRAVDLDTGVTLGTTNSDVSGREDRPLEKAWLFVPARPALTLFWDLSAFLA